MWRIAGRLAAQRLERLEGAGGGRFVDGVDDVDRGVGRQQVVHAPPAALFRAVGHVVADDARVALVAAAVGVGLVDAETFQKTLIAQDADRGLRDVDVQHPDTRVVRGVAQLRLRPPADQLAGEEVVGGERGVGGVDGGRRRVQRDHQKPRVVRLLDGAGDRRRVGRGDRDALRAIEDAGLNRLHLRLAIAVELAGERLAIDAQRLSLREGALAHLHEKGACVGLGDQTGADGMVVGLRRAGGADRGDRPRGRQ